MKLKSRNMLIKQFEAFCKEMVDEPVIFGFFEVFANNSLILNQLRKFAPKIIRFPPKFTLIGTPRIFIASHKLHHFVNFLLFDNQMAYLVS